MKIFSDKPFSKTSFGQSKWFKTPSKTNLVIVTLVWLTGASIIILGKTDFFKKTFLDISYLFTYFLLLFSLLVVVNVFRNYFKNNQV